MPCPLLHAVPTSDPLEPISFERLFEALPVGAMTCDLTTFIIDYANSKSIELLSTIEDQLGIDPNDIVGTSIDVFHKNPVFQRQLLSNATNLPHKARIKFGEEWLDLHIHGLPDSKGRVRRALLVWAIATAEVAKEQEEYRLLRMIDAIPIAVMTVDPQTYNITYLNEKSKTTLGQVEDLLSMKATELLGTSLDVFHMYSEEQRKFLADPRNLPHRARTKFGPEVIDLQVSAVNGTAGEYIGPMLTWSVITKQVAAEARIQQLAHYDTLTGLANRTTFREHMEATLCSSQDEVGLLFIDLDGFKLINDSNGHLVGDALLKRVAERLRDVCQHDRTMISRLGGDEFAVLRTDTSIDRMTELAERLVDTLTKPYVIDGERQLFVGASIGVALSPLHGDEPETLLSRADMSLYAAKAAGKKTYRVFAPELETRLHERIRLETKLRQAIEGQDGLFLYYQPITDIATNIITAREGLMRWYHPKRGWISPGEFIPVAEDCGIIQDLGDFAIRRACHDAASWDDNARVAVNVSPRQLGIGRVLRTTLEALFDSGISPDRLELEVTESAFLHDQTDCVGELRRLVDAGVRVALDDFGTGFSSLAHLRALPFDKIKIDGSFVQDAVNRPDCAAIVGVVADLGRRLGVTTVAEGVETQAHFDLVRKEGCTEVQGYLLGRPAPSARDLPIIAQLEEERRQALLLEAAA